MKPDHSSHSHELTIEAGIAIQSQQLARWASVLNAEAFAALFIAATKDNHKARTGYDICRGDSLTGIIYQLQQR